MIVPRSTRFVFFVLVASFTTALSAAEPLEVEIDATDLARKLLRAKVSIPLEPNARGNDAEIRKVSLWYPKWVPGSHAPGGPISNLASVSFRAGESSQLDYRRTPGEVYRFDVVVPSGANVIEADLVYICNQPTTNSKGLDSFGSTTVGFISVNTVLLYAEGTDIDAQPTNVTLRLAPDWNAKSALVPQTAPSGTAAAANEVRFATTSLRDVVDSPIMCGRFLTTHKLAEADEETPPHFLHVFADDSQFTLPPEIVERLDQMVIQTTRLMGSHPFKRFDILLAATDRLPANGLEHLRSTFNVLPPSALSGLGGWKGWNRLLIPHEYLHAWCGKYRRPAAMLTRDFHTPKDTELLWVYEGLTQYLGELIEARSGIMSNEEFVARFEVELRQAIHQQGRTSRSLADTAAAGHILRSGSSSWGSLRRSQDFYMEGMLLWLEIDAILREKSRGEVSLDDFCREFFAADGLDPKPYVRGEVLEILDRLVAHPWKELISKRVDSLSSAFDDGYVERFGYQLQYASGPPRIPPSTFRYIGGVDLLDSLGITLSQTGRIGRMLLGSPADTAKLAPGMQITSVGNRKWSSKAMQHAVRQSSEAGGIDLRVSDGDLLVDYRIQYSEGPKFLCLKPSDDADFERVSPMFEAILAPLAE